MGRQVKFSGTVLTTPGPVLRGELVIDYAAYNEETRRGPGIEFGSVRRVFFASLLFGDHELARWDVTDRRAEFEAQPGDYWSEEDREQAEEAFVEAFIGNKLAAVLGALVGALSE
jgi:hypothetical protein